MEVPGQGCEVAQGGEQRMRMSLTRNWRCCAREQEEEVDRESGEVQRIRMKGECMLKRKRGMRTLCCELPRFLFPKGIQGCFWRRE
jgi:hypothetical protein